MAQLRVKMLFGETEVWVPCYLDGGNAIIFDVIAFNKQDQQPDEPRTVPVAYVRGDDQIEPVPEDK